MRPAGPSPQADTEILRELQQSLSDALARALDGRRVAVVLDAPAYRNAGDLLITRGTLDALARLHVRVRWIQDMSLTSWARLASLPASVAVLLHGGGNFGGLYPVHDDYRARVFGTVRDPSAAVVLPQSVSFPDVSSARRARDLYRAYPTVTYLVRDSSSVERLRDAVPEIAAAVHLCPDAAFGTSLVRRAPADHDVFILQRDDFESVSADLAGAGQGLDMAHGDWPSFTVNRPAYRMLRKLMSIGERLRDRAEDFPPPVQATCVRSLEHAWRDPQRLISLAHVADHVKIIESTVGSGRVLITDRLHGHVAASLMGIPNVALNNADGKVEALINTWTGPLSTTHFATTAEDAVRVAEALLKESRVP